MASEIIHTPSPRRHGRPQGSPLVNFAKSIGVLFRPGTMKHYRGVSFKRHLLRFLTSDLVRGRLSPLDYYRYVSYSVQATRYFETDFIYENLDRISDCQHYLDVSSPRVVPYFLFRHLRLKQAAFCNPDVADLTESQRSVGRGNANVTFLPLKLHELAKCQKYDLITSISVVEHIAPDQTSAFIRNVSMRLSPQGFCLLTFPCASSEIIEYRDVDPYTTQAFDENNKAYFFQKYFTPELVEREILPFFDEIVAVKIFGENRKWAFREYETNASVQNSYTSHQGCKTMAGMFSEFQSMEDLPGIGVCCLLLKKTNSGKSRRLRLRAGAA